MKCSDGSEEVNGNFREESAFALGLGWQADHVWTEKGVGRKKKQVIPERKKSLGEKGIAIMNNRAYFV